MTIVPAGMGLFVDIKPCDIDDATPQAVERQDIYLDWLLDGNTMSCLTLPIEGTNSNTISIPVCA